MIFSEEKWDKAKEIKEIVKVSTALSFDVMNTPLRNAYETFIVPLLGKEMITTIEEIYHKEKPGEIEMQILSLCKRANAFLALWTDFDEINSRITDAGFQRQESAEGTFKPVYKYQEDNLRQGFKNKGFNALDSLLDVLESNLETFPEYKKSPAHVRFETDLVKSTAEVEEIYHINGSRIIFMRLSTHIRFIVKMVLPTIIGDKLYDELMKHLDGKDDLFEKFRKIVIGFVVLSAVKRLLSETGSITDRGLYFTQFSDKDGNTLVKPVSDERLSFQLSTVQDDINAYQARLMKFIRRHFVEYYTGSATDIYKRDNDHKKSFWA